MNKIGPKEKKFDPKKCIPQSWRIPSSGQHFYRYGFSPVMNGCTNRQKIFHPVLVSIVISALLIRFIFSLVTPIKTPEFHLYVGDYGYFLGMKFHINMTAGLIICLALLSLFLHYYEYLCGRGQPYMKVFLMMSGQITPNSIGIIDEKSISPKGREKMQSFRWSIRTADLDGAHLYGDFGEIRLEYRGLAPSTPMPWMWRWSTCCGTASSKR